MTLLRGKDDGCCSINFLKYALYMFNIILVFAGMAVLAVGLWSLVSERHYVLVLSQFSLVHVSYVLLTSALAVFVTAVLGCCATVRENLCCLGMYVAVLLAVFCMESMAGVLAYVYQVQLGGALESHLTQTVVEQYGLNADLSAAVDNMQTDFACCGATYYTDWEQSAWRWVPAVQLAALLVPDTCCKSVLPNCGRRVHPSNINVAGCVDRMAYALEDQLVVIGAVAVGVSVMQIFGIVIASCLFTKLKRYAKNY